MTSGDLFDRARGFVKDAARGAKLDADGPFARLQPLVAQLPRGPLTVGLAAIVAERIAAEHRAFWFPQREAPLGAALGLPDVLVALSPIDLAEAALKKGALAELDDRLGELRTSVAGARDGGAVAAEALTPEDYRALFDPAFVHFLALDDARVDAALGLTTRSALDQLRDALATVADPVKREALDALWARPLDRLDPSAALHVHAAREPRAVEALVRLFAGVASTGAADESFWADAIFANVGGATHDGARLLGVFDVEQARPVVGDVGPRARFYRVASTDLPAALALSGGAWPSDELRDIAGRRLDELGKVRAKGSLAFRRLTEAELPHEALAHEVSEALR